MNPSPSSPHRVAVVRVEVRDPATSDIVIDVLEVAPSEPADRMLGRAYDARSAGQLLADWITDVLGRTRNELVTLERRPENGANGTLRSTSERRGDGCPD